MTGPKVSLADLRAMTPDQRRPYLEAACTPEMVAHYDRVAAEEYPEGWAVTEAQCPYCGKRWVAVHPAGNDPATLECPRCGIQPDPEAE